MSNRIVLCFGGTVHTAADLSGPAKRRAKAGPGDCDEVDEQDSIETNVGRLPRLVRHVTAADATGAHIEQVKRYYAGVGTNCYDHVAGGAFGFGPGLNLAGMPVGDVVAEVLLTDSCTHFLNSVYQLFQARYFSRVRSTIFGNMKDLEDCARTSRTRDALSLQVSKFA